MKMHECRIFDTTNCCKDKTFVDDLQQEDVQIAFFQGDAFGIFIANLV